MRKNYSGLDQFSKYRDRKKQSQKFWKSVKASNKRISPNYKKGKTNRKTRRNTLKQETEPITLNDILITVITCLIVMIGLWLLITFGVIALLIVVIFAFVVYAIYKRETRDIQVSETDIKEMQRLLENMEVYQNVVNKSDDISAVKCSLDEMLNIMDLIDGYSEQELNLAGMTKTDISNQRKVILDNYDIILKQASERAKKEEL